MICSLSQEGKFFMKTSETECYARWVQLFRMRTNNTATTRKQITSLCEPQNILN